MEVNSSLTRDASNPNYKFSGEKSTRYESSGRRIFAPTSEVFSVDRISKLTSTSEYIGGCVSEDLRKRGSPRRQIEADHSSSIFKIKVWGSFDLQKPDGRSIRPTVRKSCGLLAILALSNGHRQSRKWLQTQLWSNSSEAQGAGSLRQELARLKRLLGDAIGSDNLDIWLDPERFRFDHHVEVPPRGVELLQGIDIDDEAFEDWLREQRQSVDQRVALSVSEDETASVSASPLFDRSPREFVRANHKQNCTVIFDASAKGDLDADVAAMFFSEQLHRSLDQYDIFSCVSLSNNNPERKSDQTAISRLAVIVRINAFAYGDEVCLGVALDSGVQGRRLDFKSIIISPGIPQLRSSIKISSLVRHTVETLLENIEFEALASGATVEALMLANQARKLTFKLDKQSLLVAEDLLVRAYELDPRGQFIAWRGFLRNTAFFQHRDANIFDEEFKSDVLTLEALRQAPESAIVQAFSSQIDYINQGNLAEPMHKAERAVEIDPTDPLARALLSNALTVNGRLNEGYEVAQQAIALSAGGRYEFYFHHFACMAASVTTPL